MRFVFSDKKIEEIVAPYPFAVVNKLRVLAAFPFPFIILFPVESFCYFF